MNWTKGIAPFAFALGLLLLGPVWTMTMYPGMLGASYVFGVTDGLLVGLGMLMLSKGLQIISEARSKDG